MLSFLLKENFQVVLPSHQLHNAPHTNQRKFPIHGTIPSLVSPSQGAVRRTEQPGTLHNSSYGHTDPRTNRLPSDKPLPPPPPLFPNPPHTKPHHKGTLSGPPTPCDSSYEVCSLCHTTAIREATIREAALSLAVLPPLSLGQHLQLHIPSLPCLSSLPIRLSSL
ncbi:hypothetical protein CGRA01v4_08657 [Colletotrichum graminicola]|nr:hypothetical protein CGRA01v4_08657 [Colletotrichum graminicola]